MVSRSRRGGGGGGGGGGAGGRRRRCPSTVAVVTVVVVVVVVLVLVAIVVVVVVVVVGVVVVAVAVVVLVGVLVVAVAVVVVLVSAIVKVSECWAVKKRQALLDRSCQMLRGLQELDAALTACMQNNLLAACIPQIAALIFIPCPNPACLPTGFLLKCALRNSSQTLRCSSRKSGACRPASAACTTS